MNELDIIIVFRLLTYRDPPSGSQRLLAFGQQICRFSHFNAGRDACIEFGQAVNKVQSPEIIGAADCQVATFSRGL